MAWSSEDRRKFLRALDETESRLLVLYRYLLYFLIVSVTVLAVLFYRSVAKDAFRDFLRLFGGILYLTFLAWAVGQLFAIRNRKSRESSGWNAPSPGDPKIAINFAKDPDTGARRFSFQFGSGPPPSNDSAKTMRIGFSASSLADDDKLDDAALAQAEAYVTSGADLDRKSTRLNSSHSQISYAVFCLKKKKHTSSLRDRPPHRVVHDYAVRPADPRRRRCTGSLPTRLQERCDGCCATPPGSRSRRRLV